MSYPKRIGTSPVFTKETRQLLKLLGNKVQDQRLQKLDAYIDKLDWNSRVALLTLLNDRFHFAGGFVREFRELAQSITEGTNFLGTKRLLKDLQKSGTIY